jgi:hypothetical protein
MQNYANFDTACLAWPGHFSFIWAKHLTKQNEWEQVAENVPSIITYQEMEKKKTKWVEGICLQETKKEIMSYI